MDFALTGEQELLRESARALLARECPTALVRAHMDDLAAVAPLWVHLREFSALGTGPTVDLCVFMEALGRVAAPVFARAEPENRQTRRSSGSAAFRDGVRRNRRFAGPAFAAASNRGG